MLKSRPLEIALTVWKSCVYLFICFPLAFFHAWEILIMIFAFWFVLSCEEVTFWIGREWSRARY